MIERREEGISHRRIHIWLIIMIVILSGTVVYSTYHLTNTFRQISDVFRENSELQKAAYELMNASDYLTEQVQRFTINGDREFMDLYFTEAFESRRREEAIGKMAENERTEAARKQLEEAMANSVSLMNQEYYAMKLVIEAKGITDYPDILQDIELTTEDAALEPDEKIRHATELVLGDDYYAQKDRIRADMQESLKEVEKLAERMEEEELAELNRELRFARGLILFQAIMIFFMIWLTTRLAIDPVINAVDQIRDGEPITESGSREFRYLARAYNKMYEKNRTSIEQLNYKASHDELTGAYNRAGYDFIISNIDLDSTYMMLIDVDNFKSINDSYGHEMGDKILIKLVNVLNGVFRDDDCICRIGGDEFVVFMVHSGLMQRKLIESKLNQISEELDETDDGLPAISISAGIVNGKDVDNIEDLFEKTDEAMYASKKQGKNTYTFYS